MNIRNQSAINQRHYPALPTYLKHSFPKTAEIVCRMWDNFWDGAICHEKTLPLRGIALRPIILSYLS